MATKTAPLFRKSMNGYNKEDVNEYIININRTLEDNKELHEKEVSILQKSEKAAMEKLYAATEKAKEAENDLLTLKDELEKLKADLEAAAAKLEEKNAELDEARASLDRANAAIAEKDDQINKLTAELEDVSNNTDDGDTVPADQYNNLCAKAGEILVIASTTAEDILKKANDEAVRIVNEAADKRNSIIKSFSETVDATADSINSYIKSAVDDCVKKINKSAVEASLPDKKSSDKQKAVSVLIKRR